jgi:hypothetical protein
MGMYAKYTPIQFNLDMSPNLTPSNSKLGVVEVTFGAMLIALNGDVRQVHPIQI